MKSYLVVGILGIMMMAVCAVPYLPPDDATNIDSVMEWLRKSSDPKKPIPSSRVERDLGFAEEANEPVSYSLDTLLRPESDRKGGETRSEVREYKFLDGSVAFKDLIV